MAASILTLSVVVIAAFAPFAGSTTYTLDRSDALPATVQLRDLGLATSHVAYAYDAANAPTTLAGNSHAVALRAEEDGVGASRPSMAISGCCVAPKGAGDDLARAPVGRKGNELNVPRGTNAAGEVNGRRYSGHAFDQMQGRGITPSVVDDAIEHGQVVGRSMGDRVINYSRSNNVSVVVSPDGRVITVGYGRFRPRR